MTELELHHLILEQLKDLSNKLDKTNELVHNLDKEVSLIKRDRQWGKYLAGVVGSLLTLGLNFILNK